MLLHMYFTFSLMYMPSFISVSVVVFKLLPVKVWQPTYLCVFPLCKLKILPTLRPCIFKSKSHCCLERKEKEEKEKKEKKGGGGGKDCNKPCLEIYWESCHYHMLPIVWCQKCCFMQIGKLGIAFWSNFCPLPLFHLSLLTIWFSCDKVQPRYTFEKCKYLDSPMFMWTTIGG